MLDVEPPAGLRRRVLDRIELSANPGASATDSVASAFRRKFGWIALPVAAAAVIVLALILPRTDRPAIDPATTVATGQPGPASTPAPPAPRAAVQPPPHTVTAQRVTRPSRVRHPIRAAVAPDEAGADIVWIDALAPPPSIAVAPIEAPPAPVVQSIDSIPVQIPALEIRPISDPPRERRNQE